MATILLGAVALGFIFSGIELWIKNKYDVGEH